MKLIIGQYSNWTKKNRSRKTLTIIIQLMLLILNYKRNVKELNHLFMKNRWMISWIKILKKPVVSYPIKTERYLIVLIPHRNRIYAHPKVRLSIDRILNKRKKILIRIYLPSKLEIHLQDLHWMLLISHKVRTAFHFKMLTFNNSTKVLINFYLI